MKLAETVEALIENYTESVKDELIAHGLFVEEKLNELKALDDEIYIGNRH